MPKSRLPHPALLLLIAILMATGLGITLAVRSYLRTESLIADLKAKGVAMQTDSAAPPWMEGFLKKYQIASPRRITSVMSRTCLSESDLARLIGEDSLRGLGMGTLNPAALHQIGQIRTLQRLDLRGHDLRSYDLAILAGLPAFEALSLERAQFDVVQMEEIAKSRSLKELWLQETELTDDGLARLSGMRQLVLLHLNKTHITDAGIVALGGMTSLEEINLEGTAVTGRTFSELKALPTLYRLILRDTPITDAALEPLGQIPSLAGLTLDKTAITDTGIAHLAKLPRLEALRLQHTQVTDAAVTHLLGQPLYLLDLDHTQVTDAALPQLATFKSLRFLKLWKCGVTVEGILDIDKKLPDCQVSGPRVAQTLGP